MMLIGYNFTAPRHFHLCDKLLKHGLIDYIELMVDNFLTVEPNELQRIECPVAVHIMQSRFLERDSAQLADIAGRIRNLLQFISPLYYSDHLVRFSHAGHDMPYLQELDYTSILENFDLFFEKTLIWSELLGQRILFENMASLDERGRLQDVFLRKVAELGHADILMDLTNLFVAIRNGATTIDKWRDIISSARVFHIGSYNTSRIDPTLLIDSHDSPITAEFLEFLECVHPYLPGNNEIIVTFERDFNEDWGELANDLGKIRNFISHE